MSNPKPTMYDYIAGTPDQLRWQVAHRQDVTGDLARELRDGAWRSLVLVASGSSANACRCALPLMRRELGCDVRLTVSASFVYADVLPPEDALCLVISQSGCSTNSLAALDRLRAAGRPAVGLTANVGSDFAEYATMLVDYGCGEELVGYVTKGMTCLAAFLMLLAAEVSGSAGVARSVEQAAAANNAMRAEAETFYRRNRRELTSLGVVYCIGFGAGLGTCHEAALKLGETIKLPAFAYEGDEYLHGPNLQITPDYSFFFVDDGGRGSARLRDICRITSQVSDRCFLVGAPDEALGGRVACAPAGAPADPLVAPLWQLPLFQYVAWKATEELGRWDGHPLLEEQGDEWESAIKTDTISGIMPY